MDPTVAAFLDSLKAQGLNDQQMTQLATVQNDPQAWAAQYEQMRQAGQQPAPQQPQQYPPVGQPPAQQGQMSPYGRPLTGQYTPQQTEQFRNDPNNAGIIQQIRDAALSRYGTQNDAMVLGLANKVQNEGYPIEVVMQQLRGGYMLNNPDLQHVADLVGLEYDSTESALQRALKQAEGVYRTGTRTNELFGQYADKGVASVYDQLNQQLGQGKEQLEETYDTSIDQLAQFYNDANQQTQQAGSSVLDQLASIAERLGIGAALPDVTANIGGDMVRYAGENAQAASGSKANLETLGAGEIGLAQRAISDSQRQGAQERSNIINKVLDAQNQNQAGWRSQSGELMAQLADLGRDRGAALRTGLTEYQTDKQDRELQQEIQRGTMDIQRGELDLQRQEMVSRMQIAREQLAAEIAASNNPVEQAKGMLELQKLEAEIARIQAETANKQASGGGASGGRGYVSGMPALQNWYNTPNPGWAGGGQYAGQAFQDAVNGLITRATRESNTPAGKFDPWQLAQSFALDPAFDRFDTNLLREALDIYFGRAKYAQL